MCSSEKLSCAYSLAVGFDHWLECNWCWVLWMWICMLFCVEVSFRSTESWNHKNVGWKRIWPAPCMKWEYGQCWIGSDMSPPGLWWIQFHMYLLECFNVQGKQKQMGHEKGWCGIQICIWMNILRSLSYYSLGPWKEQTQITEKSLDWLIDMVGICHVNV